jgi:2-(1,2-epoxy-1,2-dihydrophenyl)acetyl-CoA isomerase
VTRRDGVLDISFDRPERGNALDAAMVAGLNALLETGVRDEAVRVIVLRGAGDDFCTGQVSAARDRDAPRPRVTTLTRQLPQEEHRLVPLLVGVQTPVVCAVQGRAEELGLALAVAADFTIVADDARLRCGFTARATTPDAGLSWLLPRRVGEVRARELLLLDRELTGADAAAWGLVHSSVPLAGLDDAVDAVVARLASSATVALGLTKWLVNNGRGSALDEQLRDEAFGLELTSRSEDFREGLAALKDRREPEFRGR